MARIGCVFYPWNPRNPRLTILIAAWRAGYFVVCSYWREAIMIRDTISEIEARLQTATSLSDEAKRERNDAVASVDPIPAL